MRIDGPVTAKIARLEALRQQELHLLATTGMPVYRAPTSADLSIVVR